MARRRKGRDVTGWLILDKPAGPSSAAMVNLAKRAFGAAKAGHAGTLDPAATGMLAIAFGAATKTVPHVTEALKGYRFTIRFGAATDTDDAEGTIIDTAGTRPSDADIRAALPAFTGEIMQVPPAFSAVKVAGERAYARSRAGETLTLEARPLYVESLDLVARPDADTAILEMVCGKGGYVRAIARDLGRQLGCLGHVTALRRLWAGPFSAGDGVAPEVLEARAGTPGIDDLLLPLDAALADLPVVRVDATAAARIAAGNPVPCLASEAEHGEEARAIHAGRTLAVGRYRAGMFHPARVFVR